MWKLLNIYLRCVGNNERSESIDCYNPRRYGGSKALSEKWTKRYILPLLYVTSCNSQQQLQRTLLLTHTYTHPSNCPLSGTTQVSWYQKAKTNLDFTEVRDSEWQWHQLGHIEVCTSLQTDNHASTPHSVFLQAGCPSCRPTASKHWRHMLLLTILHKQSGQYNRNFKKINQSAVLRRTNATAYLLIYAEQDDNSITNDTHRSSRSSRRTQRCDPQRPRCWLAGQAGCRGQQRTPFPVPCPKCGMGQTLAAWLYTNSWTEQCLIGHPSGHTVRYFNQLQ